jgi:hypothetical protein
MFTVRAVGTTRVVSRRIESRVAASRATAWPAVCGGPRSSSLRAASGDGTSFRSGTAAMTVEFA